MSGTILWDGYNSMGGLVARRYILDNPNNNYVRKMVTLGTPWLGAPKSIPAFESGRFDGVNLLIHPFVLKEIAPFLKGAQELIPSAVYTDHLATENQGSYPLGEDGWKLFDDDPRDIRQYNFSQVKAAMNFRYANLPGNVTNSFHSFSRQDDWRNDPLEISYYHFIGRSTGTIGTVIAKFGWDGRAFNHLDTVLTPEGDGTVPDISALRKSSRGNYLGPVVQRTVRFDGVEHSKLPSDTRVRSGIWCVLRAADTNSCLAPFPSALVPTTNDPNYELKVIGSSSVLISDSFGNTSDPLSTTMDNGIDTVPINVTGDNYLNAVFPFDQNYRVIVRAPATPFSIILTKSDGQIITQAIRYVNVTLPANVLALIEITPQGVTVLKYDSDENGTFDTQVNPTINVTGTQAQDIEPPHINVNETVQGGTSRIDLEATDAGTGVQRIMYSLNGTTFQQYSAPLTLNAATTPTIYVYADDNVFNRSGLVTHNLTASNVGFGVTGPGSAPAGGQINASWNAPVGRPVDDWIGLFRVGTLNSAFLSKLYTGGLTSGNLNFVLPNQPGVYEFRYLINDGFSSVAASSPINVSIQVRSPFDFDGDGKTDVSIFRPSDGSWWYLQSSDAQFRVYRFGISSDSLVPGDFTGDGKTDLAVFRDGTWFIQRSEDNSFFSFPFGTLGDIPAPSDYDGDGKTDAAVYRPSSGTWFILNSSGSGTSIVQFGTSEDKPVAADFDGDGKADIAIFRPSDGSWWYLQSSNLQFKVYRFGVGSDKPVQGDYTGDGKVDLAVFRPSSGEWFVQRSEDNSYFSFVWGQVDDIPVPGDYDGDGKFDTSVFRPSNSTWFMNQTTSGVGIVTFGITGDRPVPNAFVP